MQITSPRVDASHRPAVRRLMKVSRFCEEHDVGKTTAYKLMKCGVLKFVMVGADRRIIVESVEQWLAAQQRV